MRFVDRPRRDHLAARSNARTDRRADPAAISSVRMSRRLHYCRRMPRNALFRPLRRWRRRRREQAPSLWSSRLSNIGIVLMLAGAVLLAVYVGRAH